MNYKQLQTGDIITYPMSFCDGIVDMPLVVEYCDSPEHIVTHNHVSAKHLMEVCGAMTDLADDVDIDIPFLHANGWTEEDRIYRPDPLRSISWTRISELTSYTGPRIDEATTYYEYEFRIDNKIFHHSYEGQIRTVRHLQHILRDCGFEDIADNLNLPDMQE